MGHEIASSPVFFWMDFSCLVAKDSSWKPSSALKQHSFVPLADFWGDHYALRKCFEKVCTAQPHEAQRAKLQTEANSWDEDHSWLNSNRKILKQTKKLKYLYNKIKQQTKQRVGRKWQFSNIQSMFQGEEKNSLSPPDKPFPSQDRLFMCSMGMASIPMFSIIAQANPLVHASQ